MRSLPEIDYDTHPAYDAFRAEAPRLREEALARLAPVLESKRRWLARGQDVFASRPSAARDSAMDALARDGAVGLKVEETLLGPVQAEAKPLLDALDGIHRARRAKGKPLKFRDTQTDLRVNGEWTAAAERCAGPLEALIERSGVFDLAHAYYPGYSARLHNVCVRQNVENQPFFRRGAGAGDPRTIGMHIDSAATATFNGVIYLDDVGAEQGPFQYVKGSNHWNWDLEDRAIRKAVDEVGFPPAGDAAFLGLPPALRRRANFGADLLDGASASDALLAEELTFCSSDCDMALFDSDGVHRGGNVRRGRRSSILFVLAIQPGS